MGKISKSTLNRVLLRTQGCQFAHNYERMQSLSLTYCFAPVLEELYKDAPKEERVHAMQRHLEYFNTHPLAIPFILGITAAIEESTDEDQKDTVVGIKTSLMGPFAGLGDSLLNLTWFPLPAPSALPCASTTVPSWARWSCSCSSTCCTGR